MGRPTKYSETMLNNAVLYLDEHEQHGDEVPSIEGLSYCLGVGRQAIYSWADEHEEFSYTLEMIRTKQARMLLNGGLTGKYNASITKLMLYNHGFTDKQEIDHTVKGNLVINRAG